MMAIANGREACEKRLLEAGADVGETMKGYAQEQLRVNTAMERKLMKQVRRSMHQGCLLNPRNLVFYPFFTHFSPSFAHFQRLDARNPGSTAKSPGENGKKSEKIVENRGN